MTNDKDTIIDAEFIETKAEADPNESEKKSLVVPKRPNKPADPNQTTDESPSRSYGLVVGYVITAFILLAIIALYIRGMYIAA